MSRSAPGPRLLAALVLTGLFMVAEVIGGLLSGSLALIADAGHMATDTAALALAWHAARLAGRPATPAFSFGRHRAQVLAAFINAGALVAISVWIAIEAVQRLLAPIEILGGAMLAIAALGLLVNVAAFVILHGSAREDLNLQGAALHVLSDLLGSIGAMIAAVVVLLTGWTPIDPLLSVLVAGLILRGVWQLGQRSWHVLMEGTPEEFDVAELKRELAARVPGVLDVHHVHLWALTPDRPLVTLHAVIAPGAAHDVVLHGLQAVLAEQFGLSHATIQVEQRIDATGGPASGGKPECS